MIKHVKRWLQQLIAPEAAQAASTLPPGAANNGAASDATITAAMVSLVVAETVKALSRNAMLPAPVGADNLPTAVAAAHSVRSEPHAASIARWTAMHATTWSPKTKAEFPRIAEEFCRWLEGRGTPSLATVRSRDIAEFKLYLTQERPQRLAYRTANKYLAALSGLFSSAQELDYYPQGTLPTKGSATTSPISKRLPRIGCHCPTQTCSWFLLRISTARGQHGQTNTGRR